jgi:hypothetical protein
MTKWRCGHCKTEGWDEEGTFPPCDDSYCTFPYREKVPEVTSEPPVFRTDGPRADLAVAYPLSGDVIGFTLTVAGKPQRFTMKRSAAASFIGRMAEVLAK